MHAPVGKYLKFFGGLRMLAYWKQHISGVVWVADFVRKAILIIQKNQAGTYIGQANCLMYNAFQQTIQVESRAERAR